MIVWCVTAVLQVAPAATAPATLSAAAIARAGAGSTPHNSATAAFDSGAPLTPAADSAGDGGASINTPPAGVQDKLRWWGEVAMQAYEAIDGSLQGFEEGAAAGDAAPGAAAGAWVGMSAQEAEMVKVSLGFRGGGGVRLTPVVHQAGGGGMESCNSLGSRDPTRHEC